jgi:L-seryl-tRNA(Ser) seleniumtransferase
LTGAKLKLLGTANHCDAFHLRNAIGPNTAAVLFVENGVVHPEGNFVSLEDCVQIAGQRGVPVLVDAAGEPDMRPFIKAGAGAVITSAHKMMGAPTSGMICGKRELVHAAYLQNWGIGRAMKVGKEGIAGCMAAVGRWYARDLDAERQRWDALAAILGEQLQICHTPGDAVAHVKVPESVGLTARQVANVLREGDPAVWVRGARDGAGGGSLALTLRVMDEADAWAIAGAIKQVFDNPRPPADNVPFHDLYWSEQRLMNWGR